MSSTVPPPADAAAPSFDHLAVTVSLGDLLFTRIVHPVGNASLDAIMAAGVS